MEDTDHEVTHDRSHDRCKKARAKNFQIHNIA